MIAFDSNYNRLDICDTSTISFYEELKKNSEFKSNIALQPHLISQNQIKDESFNDANLLHFQHKSSANGSSQHSARTSSNSYCLKLSLESLKPSSNCTGSYLDDSPELFINLYMFKDNCADSSYFLWCILTFFY